MTGILREPIPGEESTVRSDMGAQPVDLLSPHYHVQMRERNGSWTNITDRVEDVVHTDRGGGGETSRVEMPINNYDDWALRQEALSRNGARFKISYGYPGNIRDAGEFVAKENKSNPRQNSITAYERKRAKRSRRPVSRTWYDKTYSEVAREALTGHGLEPSALHITETTERLASITRTNEHDWEIASRLARLAGFELWADERGVYWQEPPRSKPPSHLFRYVRGVIGVGMVKDWSADSFGAGVPGRVVLYGRDPRTKRAYKVEGSDTGTKDLVELVDSGDLQTPDDGDQFDDGDSGFEIKRNIGSRTQQEAQRLADSIYKDYKYNALKLDLTVFLEPKLRTFTNVFVIGLSPAHDGIYSLRNATHSVGAKESVLKLRRAGRKKGGGSGSDAAIENALRQLLGASSNVKPLVKMPTFIR